MFISTHALRAEGDTEWPASGTRTQISIHALRAEGDLFQRGFRALCGISIHALRAEGDKPPQIPPPLCMIFLSTPSVRRATYTNYMHSIDMEISIHALRAEGDDTILEKLDSIENFYPRPPCGGRRSVVCNTFRSMEYFYPRPPCGGRHL